MKERLHHPIPSRLLVLCSEGQPFAIILIILYDSLCQFQKQINKK